MHGMQLGHTRTESRISLDITVEYEHNDDDDDEEEEQSKHNLETKRAILGSKHQNPSRKKKVPMIMMMIYNPKFQSK